MPALTFTERTMRERHLMLFALDLQRRRPDVSMYDVANHAAEIVAVRRRCFRLAERSTCEDAGDGTRLGRAVERWSARLEELAALYGAKVTYPGLWPWLHDADGRDLYCP